LRLNKVVVHRLFAAGLGLQAAVGLVGDQPGAGRIDRAIGDWTRSSRTFGTQFSIVSRQLRSPTRMAAMDSQLMM
jgi:hypothetical protein